MQILCIIITVVIAIILIIKYHKLCADMVTSCPGKKKNKIYKRNKTAKSNTFFVWICQSRSFLCSWDFYRTETQTFRIKTPDAVQRTCANNMKPCERRRRRRLTPRAHRRKFNLIGSYRRDIIDITLQDNATSCFPNTNKPTNQSASLTTSWRRKQQQQRQRLRRHELRWDVPF